MTATRRGPERAALRPRLQRDAGLVRILALRELKLRYRENVLDIAWALITPVAIMAVYGVVLTQSFDAESQCAPYLSSAWTGLVVWTFFATALGTASWSMLTASDLIGKVYFPREVLPLASVGATLLDLGVGLVTIVAVVLVQQVHLSAVALTALPSLAVLVVWTAALCIFSSAAAVFLRDITQGVQLFLRVGFFATPVMYEPSLLPDALAWTASVNPLAVVIGGLRDPVLCGQQPDWAVLAAQFAVGTTLLALAVLYVRSVESRMTDVL